MKRLPPNSTLFPYTTLFRSKFIGVFKRGYLSEMGEHPQTIGYSTLDSPVGMAAWMLDHDADSYDKISRAFLEGDRKSTRLNSSHVEISYAVFCLKKKKE